LTEFSTTRAADFATAKTSNSSLATAIAAMRLNTPAGRLSDLEVYEALDLAKSGPFVIKLSGTQSP
jgi:hypothetical protein